MTNGNDFNYIQDKKILNAFLLFKPQTVLNCIKKLLNISNFVEPNYKINFNKLESYLP